MGELEWLEGGDAIEAMLATIPAPLPPLAHPRRTSEPAGTGKKKPASKKPAAQNSSAIKEKPRVALDLDGVLAEYDGWEGIDEIGAPLPGAKEFAEKLAKVADIVIFTTRCSSQPGSRGAISPLTPGQARIHVIDWLEKNKIPYTDVYMGEGKPRVAAIVDDRAINCRPQEDPDAFDETLTAVKQMIKRKPRKKK
jgi:hypothetical protein